MGKMIKRDLIADVSLRVEMPEHVVRAVLDQCFASMRSAIARGNRVELRGFGTFRRKLRRAKTGRIDMHLNGGMPLPIPPKLIPHFTPAKRFVSLTNNPDEPEPDDTDEND